MEHETESLGPHSGQEHSQAQAITNYILDEPLPEPTISACATGDRATTPGQVEIDSLAGLGFDLPVEANSSYTLGLRLESARDAAILTSGSKAKNSGGEDWRQLDRQKAAVELEKKIRSKQVNLGGQNLVRHRAVLAFLYLQLSRQSGETRKQLAHIVARCFNRGWYFSRKVVSWELTWLSQRYIPEGKQGCFGKSQSWFEDEGVQLAVREWISGAGESLSKSMLSP